MKGIIKEAKKMLAITPTESYSYQRRTNDLLTRSSKTNFERMTGELTILTNNR